MRKLAVVLVGLIVSAGLSFVAAAPAQASVLDTKLYAGQVFDVQRNPVFPYCSISGGTFETFNVSGMTDPYSEPTYSTPLQAGQYLMLSASGDSDHPWRLGLYNSSDEELKYNGSAWVGPSDGSYGSADPWTTAGNVYGLYADGFFFVSSPGDFGSFVSLATQYSNGGSTSYTPTSEYNDCINGVNGEVAEAKDSAISGSASSDPVIDLVLDLQVGAKFEGATTTISGDGLKADSAYDLTMHSDPILLTQGTTDGSGAFSETVTIPADACVAGLHELTLTGIDPSDNPVSDTAYLELATDCTVMQLSDTPISASMPDTGVSVRNGMIVAVSAVVMFLLALFVYRSRRGLKFASINERVADLMHSMDGSFTRMERQAKRAAARRRLRK